MGRGRWGRGPNYGAATSLDRALEPRVTALVKDNSIFMRDIDGLVEALKSFYPEYRRKPTLPFTKVVGRIAKNIMEGKTGTGQTDDSDSDSNHSQNPAPSTTSSQSVIALQSANTATVNTTTTSSGSTVTEIQGLVIDPNRPTKQVLSTYTSQKAPSTPTTPVQPQPSSSSTSKSQQQQQQQQQQANDTQQQSGSTTTPSQPDRKRPLNPTPKRIRTDEKESDFDAFTRRGGGQPFGGGGGGGKRSSGAGRLEENKPTEFWTELPSTRYGDVGGMDLIIQDVREVMEFPLRHPEIFQHLGVDPPRGVLLHGPPGCGKTLLANAIAGELGVGYYRLSGPELVSGMSGESEQRIRKLFGEATANAPSLIFIDEIDAIAPKREHAQREMERRIVAQLLSCMDKLTTDVSPSKSVIVLGATNRADAIDEALRRAGRFDREICLHAPDVHGRLKILEVLCRKLRVCSSVSLPSLARRTGGYVGADLQSLIREAAAAAVRRIFQELHVANKAPTATEPLSQAQQQNSAVSSTIDNIDKHANTAKTAACESGGKRSDLDGNNQQKDDDGVQQMDSEPTATTAAITTTPPAAVVAVPATSHSEEAERVFDARCKVLDALMLRQTPLTQEELQDLTINLLDFEQALKNVQPSATREGFTTVPGVTWKDIGALDDLKAELELAVVEPIRSPELFESMGLKPSVGVLLYGPPGCGKTMLAKAVANASGANFISIKGPELLDKFVGESERAVRRLFQRGRASAPCVIFFDELDSLTPRRGGGGDSSGSASERVVNQLLTEMDGLDGRGQVFVIAATNRPDIIDPAMLRPGRLDKLLYIPLPTPEDRVKILEAACRSVPLAPDVVLREIATDGRTTGFSGADLTSLAREAAVAAIREQLIKSRTISTPPSVTRTHFENAFEKVFPSVSKKDEVLYQRLQKSIRKVRLRDAPTTDQKDKDDNQKGDEGDDGHVFPDPSVNAS